MDRADRLDAATACSGAAPEKALGSDEKAVSCGIAVMAKASAPGSAKTRLVPPLTFAEAAALNTAFLQDVTDNILLAAREAGIVGYAAYGPPGSEGFFRRTMSPTIGLIAAWLPNFGDCLLHAVREILARGHTAAVVLNSDSPTLPTAILVETAAVLARSGDRAVLGPSSDGGYYLLGLKAAHRRMFADIAWSTEQVAAQTLDRAREIELDVHVLPVWYDVDDVDSLRRLHCELERRESSSCALTGYDPHHARHSAALLGRLQQDEQFMRRLEVFGQVEQVDA